MLERRALINEMMYLHLFGDLFMDNETCDVGEWDCRSYEHFKVKSAVEYEYGGRFNLHHV